MPLLAPVINTFNFDSICCPFKKFNLA